MAVIPNPFDMSTSEFELFKKEISANKQFRKTLAKRSHFWFFYIYFSDHVIHEPAPFHYDLFNITQDEEVSLGVITAFRGSGKSTIMSLSFPIWAVVGEQQKRYILLISHTQNQSGQILSNIKTELETNELLISDFGPFSNDAISWNQNMITLSGYDNARITALSTGGNIRGLRDRQHRPQLIVCDDIESLDAVKTMESRDKTFKWFTHDVLPSGDLGTRCIVIGNLLHEDSLLMRLKEQIQKSSSYGTYREYPLLDDVENCTWKSKFPNKESLSVLKNKILDPIAWLREYCLKLVSDAGRIIDPKWIKYYEEIPPTTTYYRRSSLGVDLAISEKTHADYTAAITVHLFEYDESDFKLYILPNIINKRLNFVEATETLKNLFRLSNVRDSLTAYVESVAYQEAMAQNLRSDGYNVESVLPKGDKRARLSSMAPLIESGKILFPKSSKFLVDQLTNFGVEKHDDLVDALFYAVSPLVQYAQRKRARVFAEKPEGF